MNNGVMHIYTAWDAEAGVWYVAGSGVPGLVAEAATLDLLLDKLRTLVPELIELNLPDDFNFEQPAPIQLIVSDQLNVQRCA